MRDSDSTFSNLLSCVSQEFAGFREILRTWLKQQDNCIHLQGEFHAEAVGKSDHARLASSGTFDVISTEAAICSTSPHARHGVLV